MTDLSEQSKAGRLTLLVEGKFWVAYYSMLDPMDGVWVLGVIQIESVQTEERQNKFIATMRESALDFSEKITGVRPTSWEIIQVAPQHERAGHG